MKKETFQDIKEATFGMVSEAKPMGPKARKELEDSIEKMVAAIVAVVADPNEDALFALAGLIKDYGLFSKEELPDEVTTGQLAAMLLLKGLEVVVVNERLLYAKEYMDINPRVYEDMQLGTIEPPLFHVDHLQERQVLCTHRTANLVLNVAWCIETNLGPEVAKPFMDLTIDLGISHMFSEHIDEYRDAMSAEAILKKLNRDKSLITMDIQESINREMPEGMFNVVNLAGMVEEEP